ncbi:hypothetical protein [Tetzosporium hominis]|uniref:hypothetical protein n=1 Tax=Tetzosporium hominis TaxID=2020506 RepID=UPI0010552EFB|nr:hypothetical protein [Tetzosporium hominis]
MKFSNFTIIIVLLLSIIAFCFSKEKQDFIIEISNLSMTFIFGIGAILLAVISLVQSSSFKKEKKMILNFVSREFPALVLVNIMAISVAKSSFEYSYQYLANFTVFWFITISRG